jgi:hypothetical protein
MAPGVSIARSKSFGCEAELFRPIDLSAEQTGRINHVSGRQQPSRDQSQSSDLRPAAYTLAGPVLSRQFIAHDTGPGRNKCADAAAPRKERRAQ